MKIDMNRYSHKGIPVLEYSTKASKTLIFINHGIYGNKDSAMKLVGTTLVKLGYKVVAIDAFKHGQRGEAPYATRSDDTLSLLYIFDIVKQTANDILTVKSDCYNQYETYDVLGISMGGYVSYYLTTQTDEIDTVIPIISSPKFSQERIFEVPKPYQDKYEKEIKRLKKDVMAMDPSNAVEDMTFNKMIAFNGKNDDVIPSYHTQNFIQDNPELNIIYETFDTGHQMVPKMQERLKDLLKTNT